MDPRCEFCVFWRDERCTNTWSITFLVTPTGGTIQITLTPGMLPDAVKEDVEIFFGNLVDLMARVIDRAPFWSKVREWQESHGECRECPGRKTAANLRVVK